MNRWVTVTLIGVVAASLTVLAVFVKVGVTADKVAVLRTAGMTCSSCAGTISTALQKRPGVAAVEVDVERGWVVVGYDSAQIRPDVLTATVATAGFANSIETVITPEQFRQIMGREIGKNTAAGCCGGKGGGCGMQKKS